MSQREARLLQPAEVDGLLQQHLARTGAKAVFLVSDDGALLASAGQFTTFDPASIPRVAESPEIFRSLIRELEFSPVSEDFIEYREYMIAFAPNAFLITFFRDAAASQMVRQSVKALVPQLSRLLQPAYPQ